MDPYKSKTNAQTIDQLYQQYAWLFRMMNIGLWFADDAKLREEFGKYVAGNTKVATKNPFKQLTGDNGKVLPLGFSVGGHISGAGTGTSDSIPAMLSNGEYVIRAKAAQALGTDVLDQLNHAEKFAKGGLIQRFSEGGQPAPQPIDWTNLDSWKAYNQNRGSVKLTSAQKGVMAEYISRPLTAHLGSFEYQRGQLDKAIIDNKMSIAKGTDLVRVAAEQDKKALSILKPGQTFVLDQFMSVTKGADKSFIKGMMNGSQQTGGRVLGEKYPLIKFTLVGNAPGIYDMNRILPSLPSGETYSNVVDGLLARGQTAKLTRITVDRETGTPVYHVELGGKSRAKTGLFQNLANHEQNQRFLSSTREDRANPRTLAWLQEKIGMRSTMPRYVGQSTQSNMNIGRMAPTPLLPGGNSSLPSYGWSGTNQKFAVGRANGGFVNIPKFENGGMFRTGYAGGGLAMLHDKEFVMNAGAVKDYGLSNLKAMNNGTYNSGSVYNSYGVNVNVGGSNANANDIARTVIREIKKINSQNIRSTAI
jgi:hypothetical protein